MSKIFISHCVKDKDFVKEFVDYIKLAANIPQEDLFCCSLEEHGIPTGSNFVDYVKDQLSDSSIVIAIITDNYIHSQFCMCELGASWMKGLQLFPIVIPPVTFDDLKGVLTAKQAINFSEDKLNTMNQNIARLQEYKFEIAGITRQTKKFLDKLDEYLKTIPSEKIYYEKDVSDIKEKMSSFEKCYNEAMDENDKLKEEIQLLKDCKDKTEVNNVLLKTMKLDEKFETILESLKEDLTITNSMVNYLLFQYMKTGEGVISNKDLTARDELHREIKDAVDNEYIDNNDDEYYSINCENYLIKKMINSLETFNEQLGNFNDDEIDILMEKYKTNISLTNKSFWESILRIRLPSFS